MVKVITVIIALRYLTSDEDALVLDLHFAGKLDFHPDSQDCDSILVVLSLYHIDCQ